MKEATENSSSYWESYNVLSPWLYYGTDEGVFRMFPGSPGTCPYGRSNYDPRVRPWYVAASSGPKDVILVLDTSGTMDFYGRLDIMKEAAKRVVNTLGVSDHFTIVKFDSTAAQLGKANGLLMRANDENKASMIKQIDALRANGGTYFKNGFKLAYEIFQKSIETDNTSACHRAILFLTDGKLLDSKQGVVDVIETSQANYTKNGQKPPIIFTYTLGTGADDEFPREIACKTKGVWSKVNDNGDLAKSMGAYYKYFAYGLGDKINENFVSWVEPYIFTTGSGLGTTASAPVYDRTMNPPVLAGVVGMDISFAALQKAFGDFDNAQNKVLTTIVQRSAAYCPVLSLTDCQLETLRKYGSNDDQEGNENALCNTCNSKISTLKPPLCPEKSNELWNNRFNEGRTYEERTCCNVGAEPRTAGTLTDEEIKNGKCEEKFSGVKTPMNGGSIGMIIGVIIGAIVVIAGAYLYYRSRHSNPLNTSIQMPEQHLSSNNPDDLPVAVPAYTSNTPYPANGQVSNSIAPFEADIVILPPPTAPVVQPAH